MSFVEHIPEKIMAPNKLQSWVKQWKMQNQRIVFTNGVFDLLHLGHVDYLMKAADLGNRLIIGLNSDASVKMLNKGSNRPIQGEDSRAMILAAMQFVSAVCIFEEENPAELIKQVSPDVLVKGGDYRIEEIAGSDFVLANGGEVIAIPLVEGHSTTSIERRIRNS